MILQDVFLLDNLQVISESKEKGTMKISGTFQRAEEANTNNRIYKKPILEGQIKKLQPLIEGRRLCGELDHPIYDMVKLSNASHLITKLNMKGNEVFGEAEILNTPAGKIVQALIKDKVKIGISSRGVGTLTEDENKNVKYVNDDFNLITFDIVGDPSTRGAYPELSENTEIVKKVVNRVLGEEVFVIMLKDKLNEGSLGQKRVLRKVTYAAKQYGKKYLSNPKQADKDLTKAGDKVDASNKKAQVKKMKANEGSLSDKRVGRKFEGMIKRGKDNKEINTFVKKAVAKDKFRQSKKVSANEGSLGAKKLYRKLGGVVKKYHFENPKSRENLKVVGNKIANMSRKKEYQGKKPYLPESTKVNSIYYRMVDLISKVVNEAKYYEFDKQVFIGKVKSVLEGSLGQKRLNRYLHSKNYNSNKPEAKGIKRLVVQKKKAWRQDPSSNKAVSRYFEKKNRAQSEKNKNFVDNKYK